MSCGAFCGFLMSLKQEDVVWLLKIQHFTRDKKEKQLKFNVQLSIISNKSIHYCRLQKGPDMTNVKQFKSNDLIQKTMKKKKKPKQKQLWYNTATHFKHWITVSDFGQTHTEGDRNKKKCLRLPTLQETGTVVFQNNIWIINKN